MEAISRPVERELQLASGGVYPEFAEGMADKIGEVVGTEFKLVDVKLDRYPNSELQVQYKDSLRGNDVFIYQSHASNNGYDVPGAIQEHQLLGSAAYGASANEITIVAPCFGYARADQKKDGRVPISAKDMVKGFEMVGSKRVVCVNLHAPQIQGFGDKITFDHLSAEPDLAIHLKETYIQDNDPDEFVVVAPDAGGASLAEEFSVDLGLDVAIMFKKRSILNQQIEKHHLIGDVSRRRCIIVDDMFDTAGTLVSAADLLFEKKAKEVIAVGVHPILSDPAVDRLLASKLSKLVVTDSVPLGVKEKRLREEGTLKLEVVSIRDLVGEAVLEIFNDGSISNVIKKRKAKIANIS